MEMMYTIIAQELERAGLSNDYQPQDYLNFYCLGKREAGSSGETTPTKNATESNALVCLSVLLDLWDNHIYFDLLFFSL